LVEKSSATFNPDTPLPGAPWKFAALPVLFSNCRESAPSPLAEEAAVVPAPVSVNGISSFSPGCAKAVPAGPLSSETTAARQMTQNLPPPKVGGGAKDCRVISLRQFKAMRAAFHSCVTICARIVNSQMNQRPAFRLRPTRKLVVPPIGIVRDTGHFMASYLENQAPFQPGQPGRFAVRSTRTSIRPTSRASPSISAPCAGPARRRCRYIGPSGRLQY
jgi:hypothetical protein